MSQHASPVLFVNGLYDGLKGASEIKNYWSSVLTLRLCPFRPRSYEPGQALIGAALNEKRGA